MYLTKYSTFASKLINGKVCGPTTVTKCNPIELWGTLGDTPGPPSSYSGGGGGRALRPAMSWFLTYILFNNKNQVKKCVSTVILVYLRFSWILIFIDTGSPGIRQVVFLTMSFINSGLLINFAPNPSCKAHLYMEIK